MLLEFINQYLLEILATLSVIVIIQFLKGFKSLKRISKDSWKIIVLLMGIPMGIIVQSVHGFENGQIVSIIGNIVFKGLLISAMSVLIYQTGKLTIKKIIKGASNGK